MKTENRKIEYQLCKNQNFDGKTSFCPNIDFPQKISNFTIEIQKCEKC